MTTSDMSGGLGGLSLSPKQHYSNVIDGIYGTFTTPAGKICYLQTKARIGHAGSKHSQLTRSLVPAREALNIQKMDFNQLLQRDLDDHRIATKLIPYILNPPVNSLPGFYPPVVAVLLPFDHSQQPAANFPPPTASVEHDHEYGLHFRTRTHGKAYRIQYFSDAQDNLQELPLAVLRWNPDEAKLVIMDGQHRAMSLLAIERTVSNSWHTAQNGKRYAPFYEDHVKKWIQKAKDAGQSVDLSNVELPVTICWFPEEPGQEPRPRPHLAARKLFVDVNNTAKPPSEARLVLLSDTELLNIFARELLNRLRKDEHWGEQFPLYGVEYDNPERTVTTPRRWSVVTNLEILKDSVHRAVFGPEKLLTRPTASMQGRPDWSHMNKLMRERLEVGKLFPSEFHDGPHRMMRSALGNHVFPINDDELHRKLLDAFYSRWGRGILHLLSEVLPYRAHLDALKSRYTDWNTANNIQDLAKDALFEGVGMFWTIEDGDALWKDNKKDAKESGRDEPPQPDISRAWSILEDDEKPHFRRLRAKMYLGAEDDASKVDADNLYKSLITYAAQVGVVLAWASIHKIAGAGAEPFDVACTLSKAINQALTSGPVMSRDRRRFMLKSSTVNGFHPINELPRLEPNLSVFFRYLWLELAFCEDAADLWKEQGIDLDAARCFLCDCRKAYLEFVIEDRRKQHMRDAEVRRLPEADQKSKAASLAFDEVVESQAQAHAYWFGLKIADARSLTLAALSGDGAQPGFDEELEGDDDSTEIDEAVDDDDEFQI
ncbi:hypothetical protein Thimo_2719 [Thioflavicoccus mobilis 8321]|uniref:DGQHR domain-containing protein n=1 Tax=Thioflavicoccus mobilis 8321 TaxID=765912 RepID=L0H1G6_9GAMM|nr:DNA sulfur modification protein DndB [Thioflavicoccus mobilis]AGA91429.1 hypothetical protein Thimo_2719 [Thioflavicoccus mobilis 8321]